MFIVFNKEYRKIESIMSELMNKMKKSANVSKTYEDNAEVYKLATVDVVFEIIENKIIVRDKNANKLVSIDCHYDRNDELQNAKWNLFGSFLKKVRDTYTKKMEQMKKLKDGAEKAKKAEEAKRRVISAQWAKEKLLSDALEKLRGL